MTDKEVKYKTCKYFEYWQAEFFDGSWCNNPKCPKEDCPYFSEDTYECEYYVEGDHYGIF